MNMVNGTIKPHKLLIHCERTKVGVWVCEALFYTVNFLDTCERQRLFFRPCAPDPILYIVITPAGVHSVLAHAENIFKIDSLLL